MNTKDKNLIPFNERGKAELREISSRGGKASGEARRKQADFRRTLNILLTADLNECNKPELVDKLRRMGLDCTAEAAINAVMVQNAMEGNVRAYEAIAKVSGQLAEYEARTEKYRRDAEESKARIEKLKAEVALIQKACPENTEDKVAKLFKAIDEALDKEPIYL